jgi:hypothetical protein
MNISRAGIMFAFRLHHNFNSIQLLTSKNLTFYFSLVGALYFFNGKSGELEVIGIILRMIDVTGKMEPVFIDKIHFRIPAIIGH